jgi:NADPH:quinone reductase-like Zn-dependent oxidoreductase
MFYNFWAGKRRKTEFQGRLREDLTQVFTLLADGALTAHVAARMPLSDAAAALQLAESRTVFGKVVLVPDPAGSA